MTVPARPQSMVVEPSSSSAGVTRRSSPNPPEPGTRSKPVPRARSPSIMSSLSRDQSGACRVDGESARAASTSSRFVSDFDPGSESTADSFDTASGARHPSSVSVCLASPYGSNSGSEYFEISIGYQQ